MTNYYTNVALRQPLHEQLEILRKNFGLDVHQSEKAISINGVIQLLLDHFNEHPPELLWRNEKIRELPKRGRPKKRKASYSQVETTAQINKALRDTPTGYR